MLAGQPSPNRVLLRHPQQRAHRNPPRAVALALEQWAGPRFHHEVIDYLPDVSAVHDGVDDAHRPITQRTQQWEHPENAGDLAHSPHVASPEDVNF